MTTPHLMLVTAKAARRAGDSRHLFDIITREGSVDAVLGMLRDRAARRAPLTTASADLRPAYVPPVYTTRRAPLGSYGSMQELAHEAAWERPHASLWTIYGRG